MNMKWFLQIFSFLFCISLAAQTGTINGTIFDKDSSEPLMFTNIFIEGTTIGATTDMDGKYVIKDIEAGVYTLIVKYIAYSDKRIEEVVVKAGETITMDIEMEEATAELEEIVVKAKKVLSSENAVMSLQRKSAMIQDGISSQEISRYGASDAAESMKKVTGASVVDGKFIYVRGLGDRYSTAQLNSQQLPSTDPYRNSVKLDLIPSNLLDNIITSKSFTPDQPGNFTGGNVNLTTKAFPDKFTLAASTSFSYNTQSNLQDNFLSSEGGKYDWLGYDDGTRTMPEILQDADNLEALRATDVEIKGRTDNEIAQMLHQASQSLSTNMDPTTQMTPLNYGTSFSLGNQVNMFNRPLGFLVSLQHSRSFSNYSDGISANWDEAAGATELKTLRYLNEQKSVETPQVGALVNLAYKLTDNNKLILTTLYNHTADKTSLRQIGAWPEVTATNRYDSRYLEWKERSLMNYQLRGEHVLAGLNNMKIDWSGSYTNSTQVEPDIRLFVSTFVCAEEEDNMVCDYYIDQAEHSLPKHFYRDLTDNQFQSSLNVALPFLQEKSKSNKLKFGGAYSDKNRVFGEQQFQIEEKRGEAFDGDVAAYLAPENTGIIDVKPNGQNVFGNYIRNITIPRNSYTGYERIGAAYAMAFLDITPRLKAIGGVRMETTDMFVETTDTSGSINSIDFLPSLNVVYALNEKMNLRTSYTQTLARPNMREMAPFSSFDPRDGFIFSGNPSLDMTNIQNVDFRWEWYPKSGEIFAVSAYHKEFSNPIVKTFRPTAAEEVYYTNVEGATVQGLELEFRKDLGFIADALADFRFSFNGSLIRSVEQIDAEQLAANQAVNPDFEETRDFEGQSPYLLNANLSYTNNEHGIDATVAFNSFGDRRFAINRYGLNDIYEKGRNQLDFNVKKSFGKNIVLKFGVGNILNARYSRTVEYKGNDYIYQDYTRGQTYSFGLTYKIN